MIFEKWINLVPGSNFYNYIIKVLRDKEDFEFTVKNKYNEKFKVKQTKNTEDQYSIECFQIVELPDESKTKSEAGEIERRESNTEIQEPEKVQS